MLTLPTIFTLMMFPGVCMLVASFVVSFFESEHSIDKANDSHLIKADTL